MKTNRGCEKVLTVKRNKGCQKVLTVKRNKGCEKVLAFRLIFKKEMYNMWFDFMSKTPNDEPLIKLKQDIFTQLAKL